MRSLGRFLCFLLPALLTAPALAATHYVDLNSPSSTPPYTNWPTAATNIQDAVDAAATGELVLVTNGVYRNGGWQTASGGPATNRVAVIRPLTVQSVNGPSVTSIEGVPTPVTSPPLSNAVRCVYLTNGASLIGFTLTNGGSSYESENRGPPAPDECGGGVWCESTDCVVSNCFLANSVARGWGGGAYHGTLNNCVLIGNTAFWGGGAIYSTLNNCVISTNTGLNFGGGVSYCGVNNSVLVGNHGGAGGAADSSGLVNCTLVGNTATGSGGGAFGCSLNNCTILGNTAVYVGGGAYYCTLENCIIYYNSSGSGSNYASLYGLDYCCTTPLPGSGAGNITNEPAFIDQLAGNFRLQTNSPCINSGNNVYALSTIDLGGLSRISGGTVDIGVYEFQSPSSVLSY